MEYSSKLSKFSKENEVRLVVYVPEENFQNNSAFYRNNNEQKYLFFNISKYIFTGISYASWNKAEDNERIKKLLVAREYDFRNGTTAE